MKLGATGFVVIADIIELLSGESQASLGVGIGVPHRWVILKVKGVLENY